MRYFQEKDFFIPSMVSNEAFREIYGLCNTKSLYFIESAEF